MIFSLHACSRQIERDYIEWLNNRLFATGFHLWTKVRLVPSLIGGLFAIIWCLDYSSNSYIVQYAATYCEVLTFKI